MPNILRLKWKWTGFSGAPGYTVMHFRDFDGSDGSATEITAADASRCAQATYTFFDSIKSLLPGTVRLNLEPAIDRLESTTGELNASYNVGIAEIAGTAVAAGYSASSGAVVNWRTGGFRNGRRVRGRSFLVPLAQTAYDLDGDMKSTAQATIQTAAGVLVSQTTALDLGVYARPTTKDASDGVWFKATSATVPTMLAVLRSRRD